METQTKSSNAKEFFINLGAIVALYSTVISLVNLLFTIINTLYPQTTNGYYQGSGSISWPVAALIIFFPIFILLMWLMEKQYKAEPEKKNGGVHKWLTYITLFISGLAVAIDLITVIYYFLDGRDLTIGFLLKILVLFIVAACVFIYYISDILNKLNPKSRMIWRIVSGIIILGSIIWGFAVLGSPATQRALKYDEQKVNDLISINQQIISYYQTHASIPSGLADLTADNYYVPVDAQSGQPYEYQLIGQSAKAYSLCAVFNKATNNQVNGKANPIYPNDPIGSWNHPAGHYCFSKAIDISLYVKNPLPAAR